ncbi:MAG: geranylgeranyl reductase family protein [Desulfosudaceae bacterium]
MRKYDVIIIGAGPAGATCALNLAPRGGRILLLDKQAFPRNKACGGGFTRKARNLFDFDLSDVIETEITSVELSLRSCQPVVVNYPRGAGYMVTREKFDHLLVERSSAVGVEVRQQTTLREICPSGSGWVVKTDKGNYQGDFVVGADGAASGTARQLGLMRSFNRQAPALTAEIEPRPADLERLQNHVSFDFHVVPRGYAWIFPKKDHFSVGVFSTNMPQKGLNTALTTFINRRDYLRGRPVRYWKGGLIPRGGTRQRLVKNNALLVGDAAAMTDPFFGEGIYYAARSGMLAATAITQSAAENGPPLSRYEKMCQSEITDDLWWARLFNFGFYRFPFVFYPAVRNSSYLQQIVIDVNSGRFTWKKSVYRVFKSLPWWLTRMLLP